MYKRLSLIALFALSAFFAMSLCAQQITESRARSIATTFYGSGANLSLVKIGGEASAPDYYIFNVGDNQGHIIIAGDESMPDIIFGYSDYGRFDNQNIPVEFMSMLDNYSHSVKVARKAVHGKKLSTKKRSITPRAEITGISLTRHITWGQEYPYNLQVPTNTTYTGCGATGMSIVMKYYGWPLKGSGSAYGGIDYPNATYNWDLMTASYNQNSTDAEKNEVAKLMHHVGVSIDMNYHPTGSSSSLRSMPNALNRYFSYNSNVKLAQRELYTDKEWFDIIKKEIDLKRPILYSGDGTGSGHLFVCDGYDSTGKISLNYGWDGYLSGFYALSKITYPRNNDIALGVCPNTQTVLEKDRLPSQIALQSSISPSSYSPKLGEPFKIEMKLANHDETNFSGNIAIGLFQGNTMYGNVISSQLLYLPSIDNKGIYIEQAVTYNSVTIPAGTPNGKYKLKFVMQHASEWIPIYRYVADVTRELDVDVKNGIATFSYPTIKDGLKLELTKPIDVTVASNRARVRFSVRNVDNFFDCDTTEIYVMANSNISLIPTVWAKVKLSTLSTGMVKDFEINDLQVPPGKDVTSCRFYIAYSRVANRPAEGRETSADPMQPFSNNFSNYKIPAETVVKHLKFKVSKGETADQIPADYKKYNATGVEDGKVWVYSGLAGNATGKEKGAKLVTSAINIDDENYVIEWKMNTMYSNDYVHKLYISTEGQDASNFVTPAYEKSLSVIPTSIESARISLSDYVGKKVYIAFEATEAAFTGLTYFKLLNIKNPKDIVINQLNIPGVIVNNTSTKIGASVKNNSALNVKEIIASYTINGQKVEETIQTNIAFSESKDIEFTQLATLTGNAGDVVPITVNIRVKDEDPTLLHNNEMTAKPLISNFMPRKKVLVYKSTKRYCGGCTLSYSVLDHYDEDYPEYCTGVEIWRDGSFKTNDFPGFMVGTTPSFFLNDRWYELLDGQNKVPYVVQQMAPPANISVKAAYENEESRVLNIELKADFAMPMQGKYKMGAIVIENNVKNIDGEIAGTHPSGDKLVKNHIPIGTIAVNDAPEGSVINNPLSKEYTYKCSFTVPDELHYKYRKDNVIVVAVLYGPNNEILNCSQDSYYLKLRETDGLTFVPVDNLPDFKRIYDIESPSDIVYNSVVNYRATVPAGGVYRFRVRKDDSWSGYKPKLIVNKNAMTNTSGEVQEILTPDEFGVYTISNVHKNYSIEFEREATTETLGFKVSYNGKPINDGDKIEVRKHFVDSGSKFYMKFEPEVINTSGIKLSMRMTKDLIQPHTGTTTTNTMCWDSCMEPSDLNAFCANAYSMEPQFPYGEIEMIPPRLGTEIIKYTFATSKTAIDPISVEVHYINDVYSGVENIDQDGGLTIVAKNGIVEITSNISRDLNVFDFSGRLIKTLQINEGVNVIEDLAKGAYLINKTKIIL